MSELATQPDAAVPALAYDPGTTIESDDVSLPRIKIAHYMHGYVQDNQLVAGSIFSETGPDDPDPQSLVTAEKGNVGTPDGDPGLEFFVLQGPLKGWSYSEKGSNDDLETWRFDDPNRHPDAWRTYKYVLAVPDADEDVPFTLLLTKTSIPAAKQINTVLVRSAGSGPTSEIAFRLRAKFRSKTIGGQEQRWYIAQVSLSDEPTNKAEREKREKSLEVVRQLAGIVGQAPSTPPPAAVNEPAI